MTGQIILFCFLIVAVDACPLTAADRSYTSAKYGFSAQYPGSWHGFEIVDRGTSAKQEHLNIINFPQSHALHGVFLPANGAEIQVFPLSVPPASIDEWSQYLRSDDIEESRRMVKIEKSSARRAREYTEISWSSEVGPNVYFNIWSALFVIDRRAFVARLTYWKGDPAEASYRRDFDAVIRSVTVK
jgi:hypothetical protein